MIEWKCKRFAELNTDELYRIMAIRQEVFVVEQRCHYLDADGKDRQSLHVCGFRDGELVAYARIVEPGVSYPEVSIGRILTSQKVRGEGVGKELMDRSFQDILEHFGEVPIRISAQSYLERFYRNLGFSPTGKEYLEDEIPHTEMVRKV